MTFNKTFSGFLKEHYNFVFFTLTLFIVFNIVNCKTDNTIDKINGEFLINHISYQQNKFKKIVFQTKSDIIPKNFKILDMNEKTVYQSTFQKGGKVDNWHTGNAYEAIFTDLKQLGKFYAVLNLNNETIKSKVFTISKDNLTNQCLDLLIKGFQSQRCKSPFNEKDKKMSFFGKRKDIVDVHGGWYDASGEKGKYFSHLCFTNYMNPQQTPMFVWNILETIYQYDKSNNKDIQIFNKLINEAVYGADFLVRMQDKEGYFYLIVFAGWSCEAEKREICAYEGHDGKKTEDYKAGFREGGGLAIASLARISTMKKFGDYNSKIYLEKAIKGFEHLKKFNKQYIDDGKENILDEYCALLASIELYGATKEKKYLDYSRIKMKKLTGYLKDDNNYKSWWSADKEGIRPFFHAADAGLPLIALYRYLQFETEEEFKTTAVIAIRKSVNHELKITNEVNNPYGYPRQYVKSPKSDKKASFFIPHNNESGYWWQGENARISSLASAFRLVLPYLHKDKRTDAKIYATNQINWILGLNPYDTCMLDGIGRNNPDYKEGENSLNYKGGVCNGITAGFNDTTDIAFMPLPQNNDPSQRWRWSEQWLPHLSWFMLAISCSGM